MAAIQLSDSLVEAAKNSKSDAQVNAQTDRALGFAWQSSRRNARYVRYKNGKI